MISLGSGEGSLTVRAPGVMKGQIWGEFLSKDPCFFACFKLENDLALMVLANGRG
jgi:hypothetical protein